MRDFCKHVNVFQGSGVIDLPKPEGIAATWFFRKALCGNTNPAACLPFGKMSCGAYSGGYSSGYGTNSPNSCGLVNQCFDRKKIRGIAHLSHSGTGGIGFFYNYALTVPFFGELENAALLNNLDVEKAVPGYYCAEIAGIKAETTLTENTAKHRYSFPKAGGRLAIDFSNDGLNRKWNDFFHGIVADSEIRLVSDDEVHMTGLFQKVRLYFCVRVKGAKGAKLWEGYKEAEGNLLRPDCTADNTFGAVFEIEGETAELSLAISTLSFEAAKAYIEKEDKSFDEAANEAYEKWNGALSKIEIDGDERTLEIFYSNLYHSLIKPSIWTGEQVCGVPQKIGDPVCIDYATLWDVYKTQLPLVFTLFDEESYHIAGGLKEVGKSYGYIPVCFALKNDKNVETQQARMLGDVILYDAFIRSVKGIDDEYILENVKSELSGMYADYERDGRCPRATHTIDMADACAMAAELAEKRGDLAFAGRLKKLAENYKNVFDFETGLLTDDSPYYEGNKWNYSFRPSRYFPERVALSGGNERVMKLLDTFFGFGEPPVVQPQTPECYEYIESTGIHHFEGYNNEPDMETPFSYIYLDEHKKVCDIIDGCIKYMFTTGEGGIPGNNDSGGLSSCYIWNMLGIFPISGQDVMFIGSPHVKNAVMKLAGGKTLEIKVNNFGDDRIYVNNVTLNGKPVEKYRFKASEMMQGGVLEFTME